RRGWLATCGLRLLRLDVPSIMRRGEQTWLNCSYDLERDQLYSIKWYKNNVEIYRYLPSETPRVKVYNMPGIHIDVSRSNISDLYLNDTDLNSEGKYRCEVSAESPSFQTERAQKEMIVYAHPSKFPQFKSEPSSGGPDEDLIETRSSRRIQGLHPEHGLLPPRTKQPTRPTMNDQLSQPLAASSIIYLPDTAGVDGLREIVRDIVREELRKMLPAADRPSSISLAVVVREEVHRAFQPEVPINTTTPEEPTLSYAAMARRPPQANRQDTAPPRRDPPMPQYRRRQEEQVQDVRPEQPSPRKTDVWQTADRRPVDHIYRSCPHRRLGLRGFHPNDPHPSSLEANTPSQVPTASEEAIHRTQYVDGEGLSYVQSRISFVAQPGHFWHGSMEIRCASHAALPYYVSSEELTIRDYGRTVDISGPRMNGPRLDGKKDKYTLGNVVDLSCNADGEAPIHGLKWLINDREAQDSYVSYSPPHGPGSTASTVLKLHFRLGEQHFSKGELRLKCVSKQLREFTAASEYRVPISDKRQSSGLQVSFSR
ncbi:hypothetical protein HPB47_019910, partial [Ixodes persulcatus]